MQNSINLFIIPKYSIADSAIAKPKNFVFYLKIRFIKKSGLSVNRIIFNKWFFYRI